MVKLAKQSAAGEIYHGKLNINKQFYFYAENLVTD